MKKQTIVKDKKDIEIHDLTNAWKKALADYQNLEKHVHEQRFEWAQYATKQMVVKLLPVLENLEKVEKHLNDKGLSLIVSEFKRVLVSEGIKEMEIKLGETEFDANTMQCVQAIPGPENKVLEVSQKGYYLGNTLLRPATVIVGQSKGGKNV